jgi:hypothetical protein
MRESEEHKLQERAGGRNGRQSGYDENGNDSKEKHDRIEPVHPLRLKSGVLISPTPYILVDIAQ